MNWEFKKLIKLFQKKEYNGLLSDADFGLEREFLRVDPQGNISHKPHPPGLGSPLTHPLISTDFSEAQLELITPPSRSKNSTLKSLKELHLAVLDHLGQELLWPFSMPAKLPRENKIPIAQFGDSNQGRKKTIYRRGLGLRYGRAMQTISGLHFNFAFKSKFWEKMHQESGSSLSLDNFMSEVQFGMLRNFLRYNWLNTYLFGASPAVDKSYLNRQKAKKLRKHKRRTYYGPYATSLRMSKIGYSNKLSCQSAIRYTSLNSFIQKIRHGTSTPKEEYTKLGLTKHGKQIQLNDFILQIENEHYSLIRPKTAQKSNETLTEALAKRGVKYLELRALDLYPYDPLGIQEEYMDFLQVLITYCFFKKSPTFDRESYCNAVNNQYLVALKGRKPNLKLHKNNGRIIKLTTWANQILNQLSEIAALLDKSYNTERFSKVIQKQFAKVKNPDLTPSAKILDNILNQKKEFHQYALELAQENLETLKKSKLNKNAKTQFKQLAADSLERQKRLEIESEYYTTNYEDMEFSTQIIIKEALKRHVKVEILDRSDNFIRLSRGTKTEYIKQATDTAYDSFITYLIMENKHVTKQVLAEEEIRVPRGEAFDNINLALNSYEKFSTLPLVVKPRSTNFGIGIEFVDPLDHQTYQKAVNAAFEYDSTILVEEFLTGEEYRILVIGNKVVAVTKRLPANVLGDGKNNIEDLVRIKNLSPKKLPKYKIKLGIVEQEFLKKQKLTPQSVPKKGERIFLRQNSNVSTGGDPLDFTDKLHPSYKKIALKSAQAVEAQICGIDMMVRNYKEKANSKNHGIIELNFNPTLHIHQFPYQGKSRDVGKAMLDFLGF